MTPSETPLRSSTTCTLTVRVAGCSEVSTLAGETPSATSCGGVVSPGPVSVTTEGKPAAASAAVVSVLVLPERSTSTADAVHGPGAACHGMLNVERYTPSVGPPEMRCACDRYAIACCWPPGPVRMTRLSGAVPPIDGLCSSVSSAVIVTTAGPPDVSTLVGVIASDTRTGALVSTAAPLRPIAPKVTTATRQRAVEIATTTDRRLRATIASRSARNARF